MAREEDESPRYILPHAAMFKLAENRPTNIAGLIQLASPHISPPLLRRKDELVNVISESIIQWEDMPDPKTDIESAMKLTGDPALDPNSATQVPNLTVQTPPSLWQSGKSFS